MMKRYKAVLAISAALVGFGVHTPAKATNISCGEPYVIQEGDTLGGISSRVYGTTGRWSFIWHANRSVLGRNPDRISSGVTISLPCPSTAERAASPTTPSLEMSSGTTSADVISVLIGPYSPFTNRALPHSGMTSQIIAEAFDAVDQEFRVVFISDYPAHLDILLKERHFDMGHPWFNPGCDDPEMQAANPTRCEYRFSEPVFEALIQFWKRSDVPFDFVQDSDVYGKRVCRPEGWFTHDLDSADRRWIRDQHITMVQPANLHECFRMLLNNEVDLVSDQELGGLEAISELGMDDEVVALRRPVSVEAMHMLIHRSHPRASQYLSTLNMGLEKLRSQGRIDIISAEHLDRFFQGL